MLVLVGAGVLASSAQARTAIVPPAGALYPYQQWADESRVPTPDVTLSVVEDSSGCGGEGLRCTSAGTFTMWIAPWLDGWRGARKAFHHELGHNFDYYVMSDLDRAAFAALLKDPRPWDEAPSSLKEKFAEAYKWCALRLRIKRAPNEWGYGYKPTPRLHQKACGLIYAAAA